MAHVTKSGSELSPIDHAQARLDASRAKLRLALIPAEADAALAGESQSGRRPHRLRAMWRAWRRSMHGWPLVDLVLDAGQTWWQRQPLRPVGELLAAELRAGALPLVRKHPLLTVAAAGALGVLLVAGRPWRWPFVVKQVHRAPRRFGSWLTRQLGQASVQASLIGLLMVWARQRPPASPTTQSAQSAQSTQAGTTKPAAASQTQTHPQPRPSAPG